jgi:hypothetical protein
MSTSTQQKYCEVFIIITALLLHLHTATDGLLRCAQSAQSITVVALGLHHHLTILTHVHIAHLKGLTAVKILCHVVFGLWTKASETMAIYLENLLGPLPDVNKKITPAIVNSNFDFQR